MAEETPAPWEPNHPTWAELLKAGVPAEEVETRRYGVLRVLHASQRLQDATWELAAHWVLHLSATSVDEHRDAFAEGRSSDVYGELKEAHGAFFAETRRAMGVLDRDPRFQAALDGAAQEAR